MNSYVLGLQAIDKTKVLIAGGKGANLGELTRIAGVRVPDGFCVATAAMRRVLEATPPVHELLDRLSLLKVEERDKIAELSGELRRAIVGAAIPDDIVAEIARFLAQLGATEAYAVRSSATAEDLPSASFAGQQDTYLNILGQAAILAHISQCWASLFTERAVTYRLQNGFDHRQVLLAVVVQKMVFPQAAGILFTADPVTSNRRVVSIDANFGLGESLVAGLVNPDIYKVRDGRVIDKRIAAKKLAIHAAGGGGVQAKEIDPAQQKGQVLADEQILQLARIGRQIEEHFGCPQDIEWCLADDGFSIVQSRPITTLFPVPEADDGGYHVYVSTGHQQMMTDAMKPLGLSFFLLTTPAPMRSAGGRLFVDITRALAAPASRKTLIDTLGADPLIRDALTTLVEREDFAQLLPEAAQEQGPAQSAGVISTAGFRNQIENDPAVVAGLIQGVQASLEELKQAIQARTGVDLFDFIREDIQQQLRKILFAPQSSQVILGAMDASAWLNEKMYEWLGEKNAADTLSQSVPNNITSAMGLALLDVADVIRPFPQVIAYLQQVEQQAEQAEDDRFLDGLAALEGGQASRDALLPFLNQYGMRGSGEIDITRPRWSETPAALVPLLLSHIKTFEPGAGKQKFEQGRQAAAQKEQELLARLRQLPDGEEKAAETKRMIDLVRTFIGYREYPKYGMVSRYFVYKQALLREAQRLVQAGVLSEKEDIYYLTFAELREVVRTHQVDAQVINQRKDEYKIYARLTPPRVITSEGEIVTGAYKRGNLPAAALAGLPVSSGVAEGRARVVLRMEDADLEAGDILVTSFTDPSWTPLFVSVKGLVTEVGGPMTHGAVIAREYGLPAVVGVENATRLIKDGQRIRVHGTEGYVEIL